jgi:hypothetical protein
MEPLIAADILDVMVDAAKIQNNLIPAKLAYDLHSRLRIPQVGPQ